MSKKHVQELLSKIKQVSKKYNDTFPEIKRDRDWYALKLSEEVGECFQAYLMLTKRGRQKGKTEEELKRLLEDELADVFSHVLLFADNEGIDVVEAVERKWFSYLE